MADLHGNFGEQRDQEFIIPEFKKIIIIDAHDTILKRDFSRTPQNIFQDPHDRDTIVWQLREGFQNFLDYFGAIKKIKIVISSDGDQDRLKEIFIRFGIFKQFDAIYGFKHIHKETYLKQLDQILADFHMEPRDAVFIGDSKIDAYSAQKYGVDFISVPNTVSDRHFSFNSFLHIRFTRPPYGLELQRIINIKHIYHNLASPVLVEMAIQRGEGVLSHKGSLVVHTGDISSHLLKGRYIVKEPSTEHRVTWDTSDFHPLDPDNFNILFLRLKAFLQDREIFIQDCYVGSDPDHCMPLRIITQTAWHGLFARNMFIQASKEQMEDYFPEYTIIHVPHFKAIPEVDGTSAEAFVIVHLVKKVVLIGGTHYGGEIRRAVNTLISFFYIQEDILPVKFSSNIGRNHDLAVFWGEPNIRKSSVSLDSERDFFGDAYHGWTENHIFNLEWGCYIPVSNLTKNTNPFLYESVHTFSTILENVKINKERRTDFHAEIYENPRACFPKSHFRFVDRSGISDHPKNIFIFMKDGMGIFPAISRISRAQGAFYLFMGYNSDRIFDLKETESSHRFRFQPFFNDNPFTFPPVVYALHVWEKMERSLAQCWLINYSHVGHLSSPNCWHTDERISDLIKYVLQDEFEADKWIFDPVWGFEVLKSWPRAEQNVPSSLLPVDIWDERSLFLIWRRHLIARFHKNLDPYKRDLDPEIVDASPTAE